MAAVVGRPALFCAPSLVLVPVWTLLWRLGSRGHGVRGLHSPVLACVVCEPLWWCLEESWPPRARRCHLSPPSFLWVLIVKTAKPDPSTRYDPGRQCLGFSLGFGLMQSDRYYFFSIGFTNKGKGNRYLDNGGSMLVKTWITPHRGPTAEDMRGAAPGGASGGASGGAPAGLQGFGGDWRDCQPVEPVRPRPAIQCRPHGRRNLPRHGWDRQKRAYIYLGCDVTITTVGTE